MDLTEIGCDGVDWIHLALGRDQRRDLIKHGNETSGSTRASLCIIAAHCRQSMNFSNGPRIKGREYID